MNGQRIAGKRDPADTGYATFSSTIQYETELAFERAQPYLARGSFHRLANDMQLGWHPQYQFLCTK